VTQRQAAAIEGGQASMVGSSPTIDRVVRLVRRFMDALKKSASA
jgi:hypothetical protein